MLFVVGWGKSGRLRYSETKRDFLKNWTTATSQEHYMTKTHLEPSYHYMYHYIYPWSLPLYPMNTTWRKPIWSLPTIICTTTYNHDYYHYIPRTLHDENPFGAFVTLYVPLHISMIITIISHEHYMKKTNFEPSYHYMYHNIYSWLIPSYPMNTTWRRPIWSLPTIICAITYSHDYYHYIPWTLHDENQFGAFLPLYVLLHISMIITIIPKNTTRRKPILSLPTIICAITYIHDYCHYIPRTLHDENQFGAFLPLYVQLHISMIIAIISHEHYMTKTNLEPSYHYMYHYIYPWLLPLYPMNTTWWKPI